MLYERYGRQIHNFCSYRLHSHDEAEDATQLTFMNALRGLRRGARVELESAWLYKIAENVCFNMQRSSFRRRRLELPTDLADIEHAIPSPERNADELLWLTSALDSIPPQQRRAILLREWRGLSYKEIAAELELSSSAVETLLFRARRSLAERLNETPEKDQRQRKLRGWCDLASLAGAAQSIISAASLKTAATLATVAATAAVTTSPALRHFVSDAAMSLPLLRQSHTDAELPRVPVRLSDRGQVSTAPSLPRSIGATLPLRGPTGGREAVLPSLVGRSTPTAVEVPSPAAPAGTERAPASSAGDESRAAAPFPVAPGVETTVPGSAPDATPQADSPSGAAAPVPQEHASAASSPSAAPDATGASAATAPPGQVRKEAAAATVSPRGAATGQIKQEESNEAHSNAPSVPAGQTAKADRGAGEGNASAADHLLPEQAKNDEVPAPNAFGLPGQPDPPGQAMRDEAGLTAAGVGAQANVPPSQAKKDD